jgi:hypothetical protein
MRDESVSSSATEKFVVRLPRGMRRAIADAAKRNRRSMNSEIVAIIDRTLGDVVITGATPADIRGASASALEQACLQRLHNLPENKLRALLELLD